MVTFLKDPVYQVNLMLHLLMPAPPAEAPIRPLLYENGFGLHSVERSLPLPVRVREAARRHSLSIVDAPAPDVVAHDLASTYLVLECKASSFGTGSTNAHQARGLILAAGDLREPLGLPATCPTPHGCLVYLMPQEHAEAMLCTIAELRNELRALALPICSTCTFGLEERDDGLYLLCSNADELPHRLASAMENPVMIQEGVVSRPLYLLPVLPSVSQGDEEARYCRQVFLETIWQTTLSMAGQSRVGAFPAELTLSVDEILNNATHGIWKFWHRREDVKYIRDSVKLYLLRALRGSGGLPSERVEWSGQRRAVVIHLTSMDELKVVRERLETARPAKLVKEHETRQLEFDLSQPPGPPS